MKTLVLVWLYLSLVSAPAAGAQVSAGGVASASGPVFLNGRHARNGDVVYPGMEVMTGAAGQARLLFSDGQTLALDEYTRVYITAYEYDLENRAGNRSLIELIEGRLRYVAGHMAWDVPEQVILETAAATLSIRHADFTVAANGLYLAVANGLVSAANAAGTAAFSAGQAGFIASASAPAQPLTPAQLPANIAASFRQLSGIPLPDASPVSISATVLRVSTPPLQQPPPRTGTAPSTTAAPGQALAPRSSSTLAPQPH